MRQRQRDMEKHCKNLFTSCCICFKVSFALFNLYSKLMIWPSNLWMRTSKEVIWKIFVITRADIRVYTHIYTITIQNNLTIFFCWSLHVLNDEFSFFRDTFSCCSSTSTFLKLFSGKIISYQLWDSHFWQKIQNLIHHCRAVHTFLMQTFSQQVPRVYTFLQELYQLYDR